MKTLLKKRLISIVAAISTLLALLFPALPAYAAVPEPAATNVVITKLQSLTAYPNGVIPNADGSQKTLAELSAALGTTVTGLPGVTFTVYTLPAGMTAAEAAALTQATLSTYPNQTLTVTDANGQTTVSLPTGNYWVVETAKPATVSSSLAVPFFLQLPVMNTAGTGYLTDLYVYPKNVASTLPVPTKTVDSVYNLTSTKDIGDTETWYIQSTIPSNIKDYSKFEFVDTISSQLNYTDTLSVVYGTKASIAAGTAMTLIAGTDYTIVSEPTVGQAGGTLSVALTDAGLDKLTANYVEGGIISLKFTTVINETALMGTAIPNTYTLTYNNTGGTTGTPTAPDTPVTPTPGDTPSVSTGGRQFAKTTDAVTPTALTGAEFIVYDNASGTPMYLVQDPTTLAVTWTADKSLATKFTSGSTGLIAIKGLEYSTYTITNNDGTTSTITHSYYLEETKAPTGYNLLKSDVPFTIAADSYISGALDLSGDGIGETQIINKQGALIPQTGGIGTIIFTIAGLALMGTALKFARRRSVE
ncbi:MAG: SpaH/EbpB family LPXTG-anchored major pilin [Clostridiaceae bacterium]